VLESSAHPILSYLRLPISAIHYGVFLESQYKRVLRQSSYHANDRYIASNTLTAIAFALYMLCALVMSYSMWKRGARWMAAMVIGAYSEFDLSGIVVFAAGG